MSKPVLTLDPIASTFNDWAKLVDVNFARIKAIIGGQVGSSPVPITAYATTLPGAQVSHQCIAILGSGISQRLQLADGDANAWHPIPIKSPSSVSALTDNTGGTVSNTLPAIPDPANSPATADALRDDIVNNVLPAIRNNIASIGAKINALRTALINGGSLP